MNAIVYLLIWVLPGVLATLLFGSYVGYNFASPTRTADRAGTKNHARRRLKSVLLSAEQLTTDVDTHNNELKSVGREVHVSPTNDGNYEHIKGVLLQQISSVLEANRRLEHDLVCTRYRLEEQAQELDRTRLEARMDSLSGVGNRKAFDESLKFMLSKFSRHRVPFALLLIDVDHFKWINDTHGHQSGDEVVNRLGQTFKSAIRPGDIVSRFGGDEFAVLLNGVDIQLGAMVAQRIRDKVERTNFDVGIQDARLAVTLSMGMAVCDMGDNEETLLKKADAALYRSKEGGRNRITLYDPSYANLTSTEEMAEV